ncbi:hypothetical protein BME72_25000, partial [Klebsiella pneumoniae]
THLYFFHNNRASEIGLLRGGGDLFIIPSVWFGGITGNGEGLAGGVGVVGVVRGGLLVAVALWNDSKR